jgi:hypothetical protein
MNVLTVTPPSRFRLVHDVPNAFSVARNCRDAGVAFVRGTTSGWGRTDLARWLVGHYAPAVIPCGDVGPRRACGLTVVDEPTIERVVLDARARVLRTLSELTVRDRATTLARTFIARGEVLAVRDGLGYVAHAPVDRARMPLADRVVSLFVADWLNDRLAYRVVHHCGECGEVAIGETLAHGSSCAASEGRHTITMSATSSGTFRRFTYAEET